MNLHNALLQKALLGGGSDGGGSDGGGSDGGGSSSRELGKFFIDRSQMSPSYAENGSLGQWCVFEIGMTLEEWVNSPYNAPGVFYNPDWGWEVNDGSYYFWAEANHVLQDGETFVCDYL